MGICSTLLSKGYFPKEAPDVFVTNSFGAASSDIYNEWKSLEVFKSTPMRGRKNASKYNYKLNDCEPELISLPKRNFERRPISITHPIPQLLLCHEYQNNWRSIQKWLSRQRFSLDKIRVGTSPRGLQSIDFSLHQTKVNLIKSSSDWIVETDIARFYPSIYTHSITWAAYGKEKVKNNLNRYKGTLADRLDTLTRKCNRNQTIGIPIGPETSRIFAEIISSRIDDDLKGQNVELNDNTADRLQDDWSIGATTLTDAEYALSQIMLSYRSYGLDINGTKTQINHLKSVYRNDGIEELNNFIANDYTFKGVRLKRFIDATLRIQSSYPKNPIISYSLSILENQSFTAADSAYLESFLLQAAVIAPLSLPKICRIIVNQDRMTNQLSRKRIANRFSELMARSLEKGETFEAIWFLYTIRGLRKKISTSKIRELIEVPSGSVIPLLLLDMRSKGLTTGKLPEHSWLQLIDKNDTKSHWSWLMAYEGVRNGWLPDNSGNMNKPFFQTLTSNSVSFYDKTKNVQRSAAVAARRKTASIANWKRTVEMLKSLRDIGLDY